MEHKIGEIFEYNGEWYQCVKGDPIIGVDGIINYCEGCDISVSECDNFNCTDDERSDKELVIFKKLEKVGEPFACRNMSFGRYGIIVQRYKVFTDPILTDGSFKWSDSINQTILIPVNNKEDMKECNNTKHSNSENIGKNLKPFDLQAAKSGKPVCTRDGRNARIICFDKKGNYPIVALVNYYNEKEYIKNYDNFGKKFINGETTDDLMMLPEKKEGWVNIYKGNNGIPERVCGDIVSNTREEAIQCAQYDDSYITTVKISWEE